MNKLIKKVTIILMKYALKRAKKKLESVDNSIIAHAYSDLIKSYENAILFLGVDKS